MLSQNRISVNPLLKNYILKSINNSINKKCEFLLEKEKFKNFNLHFNNNNNYSGFIFFLSLSTLFFLNNKII
jgi:hypothetical protein